MTLNEMIYKRKSCCSFTGVPLGAAMIETVKAFQRSRCIRKSRSIGISCPEIRSSASARLAPSAVNSQPWYFTHEGDNIHVYCSRKGSHLDVDIALARLYVANEETFRFFKTGNAAGVPGFSYIGSVTL